MTRPMFLGSDLVTNPDVEQILATAVSLSEAGYASGALSIRYGARFCTTAGGIPFEMTTHAHVSEVVDYDPHVDNLLCIGPQAPGPLAPVHALVFRAKKEVGAIAQVDLPSDHPLREGAPQVALGRTPLEGALAVLEALRDAERVQYGKSALLLTGRTLAEAAAPLVPRRA